MSVCCGSDYSSSGGRRVIPLLTKGSSSVLSRKVPGYPRSSHSSHICEPTRSLKRRLQVKTPSPPTSPELNVLPTNPLKNSNIPTSFSTKTDILPAPFLPPAVETMELPPWLRGVGPTEILQLQADNEGRMLFGSISECELDYWKCQYLELIESDKLRYEYNFLSKGFLIKCMPLPTHDSLQLFFTRNVISSLDQRFGSLQAKEMVSVGSGTTFAGFRDDPSGASEKLPDAYVRLPDGEFPTVVCEAGWAEAHDQLVQDARLWLLHTSGQTRVVIVLSFTEKMPKAQTIVPDDDVTAQENPDKEQTVLASVNETTDLTDLAKQLFNLNQEGRLTQPLVGSLEANLHVYKASEGGGDIVESFTTKLLPPPPVEDAGPKEFGISLEELLGECVPEGHNPNDEIGFSLADLQKCMEMSIPHTERLRATRRAKKLLKSIVGSGNEETFAQSKRR